MPNLKGIVLPGGTRVQVGGEADPVLALQKTDGTKPSSVRNDTPLTVDVRHVPQALYGQPVNFLLDGVDAGLSSITAAGVRSKSSVTPTGKIGSLKARIVSVDGTVTLTSPAVTLTPMPLTAGPYPVATYDTGVGTTAIELTATGGYPPYTFANPTKGTISTTNSVGTLAVDLAESFSGFVWFDVTDSKGTVVESNVEISITGPEAILLNDPDDIGYSVEFSGLPTANPTKAALYFKMVLPSWYGAGEDVASLGSGLVVKHQGGKINIFAVFGSTTVHNGAVEPVVFDDLEHEVFVSADGDLGTLQVYVDGTQLLNLSALATGSITALVSGATKFFEAITGTLEVTRLAAWRDVAPDLTVAANRTAMAAHNDTAAVGAGIALNAWGTKASDFSEKSGASTMTLNATAGDPGAVPLVIQDASGSRIPVDGISEDVLSYTITFTGGPYAGTYTVLKSDLNKGPKFLLDVPIVTGDLTLGSVRTVDPGPVASFYKVSMVVPTVKRGAVLIGENFSYTVGENDDIYGVTVSLSGSDPLGQTTSGLGDMVPIALFPYASNVFDGDDKIAFAQPISTYTEKSMLFFARFTLANLTQNHAFINFGATSKDVLVGSNALRIITPGWSGEACRRPPAGEVCDVIMSFGPNGRQIATKYGAETDWSFDRDLSGMSASLGMNAYSAFDIGSNANGGDAFGGSMQRMMLMFGVNPNLKLEGSRLMFVTPRNELATPELVDMEMGGAKPIDFYNGANHGTIGAGTVTGTFA